MSIFSLARFFIAAIASIFIVVGCGGGGSVDTEDPTKTTVLGSIKYAVPDGVDSSPLSGADASALSAKSGVIGGFVLVQSGSSPKMAKAIDVDLAKSAKITSSGISIIYSGLSSSADTKSISLQSSQSSQEPYAFTISDYRVMTDTPISPEKMSQQIMGYIDSSVSGFPSVDPNAPSVTDLRVQVLYGSAEGSDLYMVAVVPQAEYEANKVMMGNIVNAARMIPSKAVFKTVTETFTTGSGASKMDFLFVVDDSGSMSDDQQALSAAADDFINSMSSAGVSYRTAIITTGEDILSYSGGSANRILRDVGIMEGNSSMLKSKLVAGTDGSSTETGIWNAERALQTRAEGDATDGSVTALGMPQNGANMAVIIISDEPSQYTRRSGGVEFDVSNNLFTKRGITVYAIIENLSPAGSTTGSLDDDNRSQYDDLVNATGGIYADIKSRDSKGDLDFTNIMQKIASDAGGIASQFALANWASSVEEVKVEGAVVPKSSTNGYTYNQINKSIVFHGTAVPAANSTVTIKYKYSDRQIDPGTGGGDILPSPEPEEYCNVVVNTTVMGTTTDAFSTHYPIEGVAVEIYLGATGNTVVASGITQSNGVAWIRFKAEPGATYSVQALPYATRHTFTVTTLCNPIGEMGYSGGTFYQ